VTRAMDLRVICIKDFPTFLPSFLPSLIRHALNASVSEIALRVLPAISTNVDVSVVRTAVGSPCTSRKTVIRVILPSRMIYPQSSSFLVSLLGSSCISRKFATEDNVFGG
jgi:hypothetical protein